MKVLNYCASAIFALLITSCGGDGITPVSEKIQGPLGQYFEVVSKDYKVRDDQVCIEIKRIKEGFPEPWRQGMEVGSSDGEMELQFTAEFQDADGSVVSKDKTDIIFDEEELNAIVALDVDETATVTFNVKEGATQVKIGSTFKVNGEIESTVNLSGSIGKYPIQMTMHIASDGEVTGAYYYKSQGPGNYLYVKGRKDGDRIILDEYSQQGEHTGEYIGAYSGNVFKGHFKAKSGEYSFALISDNEMAAVDLSFVNFSNFTNSSSDEYDSELSDDSYSAEDDYDDSYSAEERSEDWDSLLDSYDSYVTKYISYMKKAANGDMTALSEYTALMNKAQEFSEKMQNAQGDMTASQWARYMKITTKMAQAAQNMR